MRNNNNGLSGFFIFGLVLSLIFAVFNSKENREADRKELVKMVIFVFLWSAPFNVWFLRGALRGTSFSTMYEITYTIGFVIFVFVVVNVLLYIPASFFRALIKMDEKRISRKKYY